MDLGTICRDRAETAHAVAEQMLTAAASVGYRDAAQILRPRFPYTRRSSAVRRLARPGPRAVIGLMRYDDESNLKKQRLPPIAASEEALR
jgi:hypothetical protein